MHFTGGEVKHHKDCDFYAESFSKMYDEVVKTIEINRIQGILLGLSLAKKSISEGHGYNDILENEKIYQEELNSLNTPSV